MKELKKYQMYINGEWVESSSGEYFDSYNPATEEAWCQVAKGNVEDVNHAVQSAHNAFLHSGWTDMTFTERGRLVRKLGELIAIHSEELAKVESLDNGKLIREMRGQVKYLPEFFYYYAGLADKIHGQTLPIDKKICSLLHPKSRWGSSRHYSLEFPSLFNNLEACTCTYSRKYYCH